MVDRETALQEHLLDVAIAERIAQVPGHGLHDQAGLEVPPLKVIAGLSRQLEGERVQDHEPAPRVERQAGRV